ncbi:PD-(D/E)XK motif protein [Pedobacter chinensis]|uniref:PD-(D/E)XK motif protein n=1 Tax=Pedobacter chinensis TaxID=2282421 RepID=A0A369PPE8_9SPHI|nr:PD-(D/E)XK motif protein [Pedobacter chinensis]RDC54152.1 PD-(D/E)XK motif protein [Pedobacter chinensis]
MVNIKSIWETQKPTGDFIMKTRLENILHLNCYAGTNNITGQYLYIMSVAKSIIIPELKNYRFRGVEIFSFETDSSLELNIYLIDNDLKDIFALFVQNIIEDIVTTTSENEALTTTLNVIFKWKKLFDKISFSGMPLEYQKGLIGELFFINSLIDNNVSISKLLGAWMGPEQDDKDFRFGNIGIEIKLTSSKHPSLKITNEGQLDTQNVNELYLILYVVENVKENGFSLNSLISQIRDKLYSDLDKLKFFDERLLLLGYLDDDHYNTMYSIKQIHNYRISRDFPRIIKSQLPLGIYNTSYSIELSAVEKFRVESDIIINSFN